MTISDPIAHDRILILLAPGFEESPLVYCMEQMREAGLGVSLVSASSGLVRGRRGLVVQTDGSFTQLNREQRYRLIVVPGGREAIAYLLNDPRFHRLVESTLHGEGFVAAMRSAVPLLAQTGIPQPAFQDHFIAQDDMEIEGFTRHLIQLVSG